MGKLYQTGDFGLGIADELVLGEPARVDFPQHAADQVIQLQQLPTICLIGLQALGQLVQRELRLCQPGVVG